MTLPPDQHYIPRFIYYSALPSPQVDISAYRLVVKGNVKSELSYTYDQLVGMIDTVTTADFHCVEQWSIKDVAWEGVSISRLLKESGASGSYVLFESLDGYTSTVEIEDAAKGFIALKMYGRPLKYEEGYPARPFFPHLYAWKSAKWLTAINVLNEYVDGYWEERGYHERGNVWQEERFKSEEARRLRKSPMVF
ncbi:MAG: molybdopterin-dependent oxidoreductase [Nitrososphaerota archaeon]|nr:molybdopterin-dependent oxidoreductase [Nitrososphaerota archaeon]MDG6930490.1 molybdopterin-dependent oxidoreductase [Nitrososphaerota archaeon]